MLISGILLGINQLSPNVFNEVHIVLASNEVGVFSLELSSSAIPSPIPSAGGGSNAVMGREEMRMEDLLQAQFENEQNLLAFEGMATFSINMLIHQINKSESGHPEVERRGLVADGQSSTRRHRVADDRARSRCGSFPELGLLGQGQGVEAGIRARGQGKRDGEGEDIARQLGIEYTVTTSSDDYGHYLDLHDEGHTLPLS